MQTNETNLSIGRGYFSWKTIPHKMKEVSMKVNSRAEAMCHLVECLSSISESLRLFLGAT